MMKWIDRSLVKSPYYIGLCRDEESFRKQLLRLKISPNHWPLWVKPMKDGAMHVFENKEQRKLCLIVCINSKSGDDPNAIVGLLIHEAVHVWQYIKQEIGDDEPSKEFEAYSIQSIAQELIVAYSTMESKKKDGNNQ